MKLNWPLNSTLLWPSLRTRERRGLGPLSARVGLARCRSVTSSREGCLRHSNLYSSHLGWSSSKFTLPVLVAMVTFMNSTGEKSPKNGQVNQLCMWYRRWGGKRVLLIDIKEFYGLTYSRKFRCPLHSKASSVRSASFSSVPPSRWLTNRGWPRL